MTAVEQQEGRELRLSPLLVRTKADLLEAVCWLERSDTFVVDVETDNALPVTNEIVWIGLGVPDRLFLIPMGHPRGRLLIPATTVKRLPPEEDRAVLKSGGLSQTKKSFHVPATFGEPGIQLRQDEVFSALRPLLFSGRVKVGHNLKFDLESIAKYYGGEIPPGPYFDTLLMTHVLDENLPQYGLKHLVMDWLRVPRKPVEVRKNFYPNLGKIGVTTQPIEAVARYLAKDVWYTHLFRQAHIDMLRKNKKLSETFDIEMQVYPVLMQMELTGVKIDVPLLKARGAELAEDRQDLAQRIWTICGEEFPLTNINKKRHYLFGPKQHGGQGLKPLTFTAKTNTPQLNTAMLEHYAPTNDLARYLKDWADKEKLIGTFIEGLESRLVKGRLHSSFNQHRTVTGRLSSNNPNLQQIPRGELIRSVFMADPGCSLIVADYDQIELRCAAALSEDTEMISVFVNGMDIHTEAAAAMYDVPADDVTPDQRQVGKAQPDHAQVLTPKGWVRIDALAPGDFVVDPRTGGPTAVTAVYPQGVRPTFRVTFSDGAVVECDEEHLWRVGERVLPLSVLRDRYRKGREYRYSVPLTAPVEFPHQELPLPPYVLGVLLGDGSICGHSVGLASVDDEVIDRVRRELPDFTVRHLVGCMYTITTFPHQGPRGPQSRSMQSLLRSIGVWGKRAWEKAVPERYLYSSVADREALLQGLLDTDGSAAPGYIEFCSSSKQLARDVQWLVRSLGGTAKLAQGTTTHRDRYRVHIGLAGVQPFSLSRKRQIYRRQRAVSRKIIGIEPLGEQPCRCIAVASPDHLYITDDFVVTHNTMNFGTLYGAGPSKVAAVAETDIVRAQEFIRRYYDRFAGLSKWKDDMIRRARRTGNRKEGREPYTEIPPWGRRRRLVDLYSIDDGDRARAERQVINAIVQGFASNIMKLAMIDLHDRLATTSYRLLLNVHDELILQAPTEDAEAAKALLLTTMEGVRYSGVPILGEIPLTVKAGIAQRWSEAKS